MTQMTAFGRALMTLAATTIALPALADDPAAVTHWLDEAKIAAGDRYLPVQQHLCYLHSPDDENRVAERRERAQIKPTRVFDDLYYLGIDEVASWGLASSAGIILFDALNNAKEASEVIAAGASKLGLDPRQIKYVVLTHGHGDHFGGAQFLKSHYGAKVLAAPADWAVMGKWEEMAASGRVPANWNAPPAHDQDIADRQTLTLGDSSVQFFLTPGHTPGTVSSIFTVTDKGKKHVVAQWGGIGLPTNREALDAYLGSLDAFEKVAASAGADVILTNHPHADMSLEWVSQIGHGHSDPNPLVVGPNGVKQWFSVVRDCALAQQARLVAGVPPMGRGAR